MTTTGAPRGVLFVHNNFPAQFGDLAATLVARGVPCAAVAAEKSPGMPELRIARYRLGRGSTPEIFPLAIRAEADMLRGRAAMRGAQFLKNEGFDPAVIVGHSGWGETVFLSEVYPRARQVLFPEFFYRGRGLDVGFDTEFIAPAEDGVLRAKAKNAVMSLCLARADAIVCPTAFQASTLPEIYRPMVRVFHEGVDTAAIRPGPASPFALADGRVIQPGTPVITHINNQLEPLRGLHILLRALPRLQAAIPDAQVLIIGSEQGRGYGGSPPGGGTWKDACLAGLEGRLDPARTHFLGRISHERMLAALRLSTAHVYYTYPFVLSWSLAEAMASGCYIIGSDTGPLHEAIQDGVNGRLLPFFDVEALSEAMIAACRDPAANAPLRAAARETAVAKFDRARGRARWLDLLRELGVAIPDAPAAAAP